MDTENEMISNINYLFSMAGLPSKQFKVTDSCFCEVFDITRTSHILVVNLDDANNPDSNYLNIKCDRCNFISIIIADSNDTYVLFPDDVHRWYVDSKLRLTDFLIANNPSNSAAYYNFKRLCSTAFTLDEIINDYEFVRVNYTSNPQLVYVNGQAVGVISSKDSVTQLGIDYVWEYLEADPEQSIDIHVLMTNDDRGNNGTLYIINDHFRRLNETKFSINCHRLTSNGPKVLDEIISPVDANHLTTKRASKLNVYHGELHKLLVSLNAANTSGSYFKTDKGVVFLSYSKSFSTTVSRHADTIVFVDDDSNFYPILKCEKQITSSRGKNGHQILQGHIPSDKVESRKNRYDLVFAEVDETQEQELIPVDNETLQKDFRTGMPDVRHLGLDVSTVADDDEEDYSESSFDAITPDIGINDFQRDLMYTIDGDFVVITSNGDEVARVMKSRMSAVADSIKHIETALSLLFK